jgi:hypothetical protein
VSRALRTAAAAAPCFARAPAGWGASRTPRVNGRLLYVVLWILRLTQVVFCIPMWYNTTPSEKSWSESQLGLWHSQLNGKTKKCVPNQQPNMNGIWIGDPVVILMITAFCCCHCCLVVVSF